MDVHAQIGWSFFETEILHDVRVIKVLQRLTLHLQGLNDSGLPIIALVTRSLRQLDLLHSNHLARGRVQREVHSAVRALPNELTTHPPEYGFATTSAHMPIQLKYGQLTFDTSTW